MKTDVHSFWSFIGQSAHILIILACFASAQAGSLQEAIIKDSCSKYSDPKTIEPLKKFVEPALKNGCVACHLDCNQLSPANMKEPPDHYLKAKEPALCMECHATLGKDLAESHDHQPLENSRCSSCHDPHSSDRPKLILQYSHGPFATRSCSDCHPAPEGGKIGLLAADVDALCYKCHAAFKAEIAGKKSQHKLLSQSDRRSCVECHDPHAANHEYALKKPVRDLCVSCHAEQPEQKAKNDSLMKLPYLKLSSKFIHEPTKKTCLICHDAHASEFPRELRVSEKDLCMECHGPNSETIVQSSKPFPLFKGLVTLPAKSFEKLPRFELAGNVHEPVNVSCALCHDAHASDHPTKLYAPVQDVCLTCHSLNTVKLYQTEQPTPLFGGRVILPAKPFQNLKILNLVAGMAGHPTAGHPVFVAANGDQAELNCVTCHDSHSVPTRPALLVGDKMALCEKCHERYGG